MYQVTVRVSPSEPSNPNIKYSRKTYKGLYLPNKTNSKVNHEKIRQEVEGKLRLSLEENNPNLQFKFFTEVQRVSMDFCFHENE